MKTPGKYIAGIPVLLLIIISAGFILIKTARLNITPGEILVLSLSFSAITLLISVIVLKGRKKEPSDRTMYILVAISVKLLLEMVLALMWFFVAKKNGLTTLLLFFVLYLAFSLYSIFFMLNTLKDKSL